MSSTETNNTLISVRDQYRKHAIRTDARLQIKMNAHLDTMEKLVKGESVSDSTAPLQNEIVGLTQARDFYIDAAEKIDNFIADRDPGDENDHQPVYLEMTVPEGVKLPLADSVTTTYVRGAEDDAA